MKTFLIYSLDGANHKVVPCAAKEDAEFKPVELEWAKKSALAYSPILFRELAKDELAKLPGTSPETSVAMIKRFDVSEYPEKRRREILKLLKCYYKRADDIREELTNEGLVYIYDDWDMSVVSPKLVSRILPRTREDAEEWCEVFAGWFGENDPVCRFWRLAIKKLF